MSLGDAPLPKRAVDRLPLVERKHPHGDRTDTAVPPRDEIARSGTDFDDVALFGSAVGTVDRT